MKILIGLALAAISITAFGVSEHEKNPPPISDDPKPPPRPNPAPAPYPNDAPRAGYPVPEPPFPIINQYLPKRVQPWTTAGGRFTIAYGREVCRSPGSYINCVNTNTGPANAYSFDWGFRIYRKDTGAYLGTIDRNVGEEIQRDYDATMIDAENRHPESAWIARKEAEKAQLEYIAAACASGGVYCTGMAAKMPDKFKLLFSATCSLWSGLCVAEVSSMKLDLQKRIDAVKAACGSNNDQACYDAVTGGGEKQARAQRAIEKAEGSGAGGGGQRPPHNTGRPIIGDADPIVWYDPSCSACKVYEGKQAEDY